VNCTSCSEGADRRRAVRQHCHMNGRRDRRLEMGDRLLDLVDRRDDIGAGQFENDQEHVAFAIAPGGLLGVLRPDDRLADVAHPQRRAVAIGDDEIVPLFGSII